MSIPNELLPYIVKRKDVFKNEIFYLMRHGGGGFNYRDCYSMPIKTRQWMVKKLSSEIKAENEQRAENSKATKPGTQFSMNDMITGKGADKLNPDYNAPPKNPRKPPKPA
jgi:hypothetical protein